MFTIVLFQLFSFSGWCRDPGLKLNQPLLVLEIGSSRVRRRSLAKRWLRRTGTSQEQDGSQGVGLVFPVGGKPGARARSVRSYSQEGLNAGQQGSKANCWSRRTSSTQSWGP